MTKNLFFWLIFGVMSVLAYSGAVFFENQNHRATVQENQATTTAENEASCIESLLQDVKPLLQDRTCAGQHFSVPRHWYLNTSNICTGQLLESTVNPRGLDNFEFRKRAWRNLIYQMGYKRSGIEPLVIGVSDVNNWFECAMIVLGMAATGGEIPGGMLTVKAPANSSSLEFIISRYGIGQWVRSQNYKDLSTTYRTSLLRAAKEIYDIVVVPKRLSQLHDILHVADQSAEYITVNMSVADGNFLLQVFDYQEFLNEIADRILQASQSATFDPAMIAAANEIVGQSLEDTYDKLVAYMQHKANQNLVDADISLIKLVGPIIVVGAGAVSAPVAATIVLAYEILSPVPALMFYWDDNPYTTPVLFASLSYTLAQRDLGSDALGYSIRTMSLILGDEYMKKYFEPDLYRMVMNIWSSSPVLQLLSNHFVSAPPPDSWSSYFPNWFFGSVINSWTKVELGQAWHDLAVNGTRDAELGYMVRGYLSDRLPCSANVKGRVITTEMTPVPNASVSVINERYVHTVSTNPKIVQIDPFKSLYTTSDDNGYFSFRIIEDGNYLMRVSKDQFCTEEVHIKISNGKMFFGTQQDEIINITLVRPRTATSGTLRTRYIANSFGSGIFVDVDLDNTDCADVLHILPFGTTFRNRYTSHQNILAAKESRMIALADAITRYRIPAYCISRQRQGVYGELYVDSSLSKRGYEAVTKLAEERGWHESEYHEVQNAVWYFSDGVGVYKGTKAERLVKAVPSAVHTTFVNKVDAKTAVGSILCTLLTSLPLFFYSRKFF